MRKNIQWIDCAKCMAILAVMTDHTNRLLYTNSDIAYASYYSVTLFILISGMMSYLSNVRHSFTWWESVKHSTSKIILAYMFAVLVYHIAGYKSFNLQVYIQNVISFNISGPLYYVLLYLQLMFISRPLYNVLNKCSKIYFEIILGIVLLYISSLTTLYSNILDVYGGGGKLLGGTYLFVFYIGMLLSKHDIFKMLERFDVLKLLVISSVLWIAWWRWLCVDKLQHDIQMFPGGGQVSIRPI